jgi:lipopolysaccharide biosynthesis regulator YciM
VKPIFNMILRNLRTELERIEKENEELVTLRKENSRLKVELQQQKQIDALTEITPVFQCTKCGWVPPPGSIVNTDAKKQMWQCPSCKEWKELKR